MTNESEPRNPTPNHRAQRHDAHPEASFPTRLVVGVIIIALGAILLADNLGLFDATHVLHVLWPLALVAVGVGMVRKPTHPRGRAWGWVLITVGIWIFAHNLGWLHLSVWQLLVPGVLLFAGGMMVRRALTGSQEPARAPAEDHVEFVRSFAFMSSCELRPVSRPFRGADLDAVMGSIKLDLTDARMEADSATIDLFGLWSAIEIFVPPDWTVTSKVTNLLAGFVDKRRPTSVVPTRTLVIRGTALMSGIEVKN